VVAFAGTLKPWHGGLLLSEAFVRARERCPKLRLVYIGDGPERKAIEQYAVKHGIESHVRFMGAQPHDDVPELLRGADILAAPYLEQERFYFSPLKLLEYLAIGRPIVTSRIGEIPELIDSSCGRLFTPGNRGELAAALVELADSPELRVPLGIASANKVEGHDWSDRVETILGTFGRLRHGQDRPRPRVAYVLKMFPRFSETFIVNEVLELERQGLEIRIFSMKVPSGKRQWEPRRPRPVNDPPPAALWLPRVSPRLTCVFSAQAALSAPSSSPLAGGR
jgi:hypothetical protein